MVENDDYDKMKRYKVDPALIFLLRKDVKKNKERYRKIKSDNLLEEEDFLISNEFNKFYINSEDELIDVTKVYVQGKEKRIKQLEKKFIEVSELAQRAVRDVRKGFLIPMRPCALVDYGNKIENSMKTIIRSIPEYYALIGEEETHPNYDKALVCANKALNSIREEILMKRMFGN